MASLKSSTAKIQIEELLPGNPGQTYEPATCFSTTKSTRRLRHLPDQSNLPKTFRINETFIASNADAHYRIVIRSPAFKLKPVGIQLIIDGVEQGTYVTRPGILPQGWSLSYRKITTTTCRNFMFSRLDVRPPGHGAGDYMIDKEAQSVHGRIRWMIETNQIEGMEYMVRKSAVGSIRVNLYDVKGKVKKNKNRPFPGMGEWKPCTAVDEIGKLKLGPGIDDITTLANKENCEPGETCHANYKYLHPFETFVFRYRPYEVLKDNNLLIIRLTKFQKFTRFLKNLVPSFSKKPKSESQDVISDKIDEKFHDIAC